MLKIKNVSKTFGSLEVLKNINLSIENGEIISLLGESGSGKSTILNIIAGFEEADSGTCVYDKKVMFDDSTLISPEQRNIGFVFQNYALFPHLNIAKNISFGMLKQTKQEKNKRLQDLLEMINMQDMKNKYPHQISGGQQQRVAIARVLARESELILFDEPFSSIDTTLKEKLISEIKEIIKQHNKTAIFVTHCPREAILLSDKIGYIENGEIIQFDTLEELCKNPASESIKNLFSDDSFVFKGIDDLRGK